MSRSPSRSRGAPKPIAKSGYLRGLQCELLLWTHYNEYESIPKPGPAQQAIFDLGHRVGALAQQLWPEGVEVPHSWELPETHGQTLQLFPERRPIFEASFLADRRYCRVDILEPNEDGSWNLIEVKAGTKVKPINEHDVSFQAATLRRAGIELDEIHLMHVDREYLLHGEFDIEGFFRRERVTAIARAGRDEADARAEHMLAVIDGPRPTVPIGTHCDKPYECPLKPMCWREVPADSPMSLYRFPAPRAFEHYHAGRTSLLQIPSDELNPVQRIQQEATRSGRAHLDPPALRRWLDRLRHPLYHLDFETMSPGVPLFEGTRPYQRIPFQFSLHVQDTPGAEPRHLEFLHEEATDPRPALIEALHAIGPEGTVLVYNQSFEKGVLLELARDFPTEAAFLHELVRRIEDLIVPFRAFHLYHPAQHGSCSIKRVLPAFTELGYEGLGIQEGETASMEYLRAVYGEPAAPDRGAVLARLREYCRLDTRAMVELLDVVRAASRESAP